MSRFVLDCSVAAAWCLLDEQDGYAEAVLRSLGTDEAIVPPLWVVELLNVLLVAERRGRVSFAVAAQFLDLITGLAIAVDDPVMVGRMPTLLGIGRLHGLSSYDACYLDVALRRNLPLAIKDGRLKAAAQAAGISLFYP